MTRMDYIADNGLCKALIATEESSSSIDTPHFNRIWDEQDLPEAEGVVRVNAGHVGPGSVGLSVSMESKEDEFDVGATAQLTQAQVLELIRYLVVTTHQPRGRYLDLVKDAVEHRESQLENYD